MKHGKHLRKKENRAGRSVWHRCLAVLLSAAMLAGVKSAAKSVKTPNCPAPVRMVTIGGAASMAGILVCGIADYIWNYPRVMVVFWFVFATMLSGVKLAKKSK